jgi:ornithine cyclodeaminase/alanine dehydrogenase-like protein (mu-crystallin family)
VGDNPRVPLYLTESDVAELLTPADAVEAIEACFRRMAAGSVENRPRYRLGLENGALAVMAASDLELGFAGAKVYAGFSEGARFVVVLFRADAPELVAVIDADKLGQLRTGAASGVAARHLAKSEARSLGLIGCGWQAESQLAAIRVVLPELERVVAYCRTEKDLRAFCEANGAEPGESHQDAAECDVVVTVTSSRDPVLRGEWLRPGALVCAVGANDGRRRELDNVVLERAAFVCCDSLDDAKLESGDLIEPVESGVLDWLEVHELQEVVAGEVAGRQSDDDIVVFKSNGLAAWDVAVAAAVVERAQAAGAGVEVS